MIFLPDKPADNDEIRLGAKQIRDNFNGIINDGIVIPKPAIYGQGVPENNVGQEFERYIDTLTGDEYVKSGTNWRLMADFGMPVEKTQSLGNVQGTVAINAASGNIAAFTAVGDITVSLEAAAPAGYCRVITLVIANGGSCLITWPVTIKWSDGSAPTLTEEGVDLITLFTVDGGNNWFGMLSGGGFN